MDLKLELADKKRGELSESEVGAVESFSGPQFPSRDEQARVKVVIEKFATHLAIVDPRDVQSKEHA